MMYVENLYTRFQPFSVLLAESILSTMCLSYVKGFIHMPDFLFRRSSRHLCDDSSFVRILKEMLNDSNGHRIKL